MPAKPIEGGTTYGPSWNDVATYALEIWGSTGWKVHWDAHVENIAGRPRTYWKVHAVRPAHLGSGLPPVFTRGDFFPAVDAATVPALLHRLLAKLDGDLAQTTDKAPLGDLPLFRGVKA